MISCPFNVLNINNPLLVNINKPILSLLTLERGRERREEKEKEKREGEKKKKEKKRKNENSEKGTSKIKYTRMKRETIKEEKESI